MKPHETVAVEVGLTGGHVILNLPHSEYLKIKRQIHAQKRKWLMVELEDGAEFELNIPAVQYMRMRPSGVRALSKKSGVTIKTIAKALDVSYDYFRQSLKAKNILLEKSQGRRVPLSSENIARLANGLNLNATQIKMIKALS